MIKLSYSNNQLRTVTKQETGTYKGKIDGVGGTIIFQIVDGDICGKVIFNRKHSTKPEIIVSNMVDGVVNGVLTVFWKNGNVKEQCAYVDGLRNGVLYGYNGGDISSFGGLKSLATVANFKNGKLHGICRSYVQGYFSYAVKYENGERVNLNTIVDPTPKTNPYQIPTLSL